MKLFEGLKRGFERAYPFYAWGGAYGTGDRLDPFYAWGGLMELRAGACIALYDPLWPYSFRDPPPIRKVSATATATATATAKATATATATATLPSKAL